MVLERDIIQQEVIQQKVIHPEIMPVEVTPFRSWIFPVSGKAHSVDGCETCQRWWFPRSS